MEQLETISISYIIIQYSKNLCFFVCSCKGVLRDLIGGNIGLLDPLGLFKPKGGANSQANSQSLGGGINVGPIGVGGGYSSSSASASANGGLSSASAKADAQAQGGYGGYGNSNAQANANANAGRFHISL